MSKVAFYGVGLNSPVLLDKFFVVVNPESTYDRLFNIALGNVILIAAGLIPGIIICFCLIDKWGRKPIQALGFGISTVILGILGV